jgi:hypothetical protein
LICFSIPHILAVSASIDAAFVPTIPIASLPNDTTAASLPTASHTAASLPATAVAAPLPIDTNVDGLIPAHLNPDKVFFYWKRVHWRILYP